MKSLGKVLFQHDWCPYKRRFGWIDMYIGGKLCEQRAEMHLHAKEHQRSPETH